ncbi:MAG: germination protein YpeB [Clostridium sp.]|nr:germination protein YpeB [Clostridium sp.]
MTKRSYIRIISFTLAIIVSLGIWAIINMNHANSYKMQLENTYQQSLNELAESLDSIETNLTKSIYSNSDKMLLDISADLYAECGEAKDALSRLPVSQMNLSATYKFISQSSDYAGYIAKKISSGQQITDEEHKNLSTLLNYAQALCSSVDSMVSVCNSGGKITASNVKSSTNIPANALATDMTTAEEAFSNYPTLLYDGPFADAVLNRSSQLIKDKDTYSQEEARKIAATALGCNTNQVSFETEEDGNIPCYVYNYGQKTIGITKQGGYVAYILYGGKINQSNISEENARNIAQSFLNKLGYENMAETYFMCSNNICVINFAYKEKDVTYYSDLIKVGISMADGKILSLEAEGYLTNHMERESFKETIKQKDAQKKISSYLKVMDSKKCVIPLESGLEVQCYEFHCESKETGEEVLIYVNSQTGYEENILLLLYSDGGTLTK